MTSSKHDDLVTSEGVDEGSAASTAEGKGTGGGDVRGARGPGQPRGEEDPGAPLPVATGDVGDAGPPGQELAVGEG